ncbi:hypothetical protein M493_15610 [Geobacillus genomosp. 3]|uniref:Uncharacterized protein n=1 Tax=Geobacillus genomosp. 3 TaxID=1921421 RepID=S5ZSB8_GEOG3|nr:hypothetical protein M493_15610 [Geobacillus genomosp. 3]
MPNEARQPSARLLKRCQFTQSALLWEIRDGMVDNTFLFSAGRKVFFLRSAALGGRKVKR